MVVYNQEWVFEKCSPVELVRKMNNSVIAPNTHFGTIHFGRNKPIGLDWMSGRALQAHPD